MRRRKGTSKGKEVPGADFLEAAVLPNPAVLAVAKSLLEGAGLRFFIRNEGVQSLFGWGEMGTGYNFITGPPVLMVEAARAEEARELLEPLLKDAVPPPKDEDV